MDTPESSAAEDAGATTRRELKALMREAKKLIGDVGSAPAADLSDLRDRLQAALHRHRGSLASLAAAARQRVEQADTLVREYPYCAIGAASGAALVAGILIGRRHYGE